jgi:adenylate cyclase
VRYVQGYLIDGDFVVAIAYSLIFAFSVNFVRMISRKMGQGELVNYVLGTYYSPVHQTRIIMFVNLVDSKKIGRDLGPYMLHEFLNDLFYDFSIPVVNNQGIIYEYIEDLVVITWANEKGMRNANCIRTFFDLQEILNSNREKYLKKYGFIPRIQAGLHTGSVVRAEIGEVKTQIVFHGDLMNSTARILDQCKKLNMRLIVSDQLLHFINLPRVFSKTSIGEIMLRGKRESLKLFEVVNNAENDA